MANAARTGRKRTETKAERNKDETELKVSRRVNQQVQNYYIFL